MNPPQTFQDVIQAVKSGELQQSELADKAEVSKAAMSQYVAGINEPRHSIAIRIIEAAGEILKKKSPEAPKNAA